ncbi:uncharacterized protein LOC135352461 [Halichondria panicea]|uniref:uncharacterized protein LOC135352461 n=1 Tax=Halichondria panicea TaxID=6063 RepID=UPI00312B2F19
MHDFIEGIEVLQSIAHLWEKGKKVVVGEAADTGEDVSSDSDDSVSDHIKIPPPILTDKDTVDLLQKAPYSRQPLSTIQDNTFAIKMPPAIKKRGRPKGAGLTVIGLPKKKGKASSKPKAFVLKSEWEKTKVMLNWFVDEEVTERAVRGGDLIEEHEVECCPRKYPEIQVVRHIDFTIASDACENGNGNCFLHPVVRLDMIPVQCTNVITSCSFTTGLAD